MTKSKNQAKGRAVKLTVALSLLFQLLLFGASDVASARPDRSHWRQWKGAQAVNDPVQSQHLWNLMKQNLYKYDQLISYFTFDDGTEFDEELGGDSRRIHNQQDAEESNSGRNRYVSRRDESFYQKLHKIVRPLIDAKNGKSARHNRLRRMSGEYKSQKQLRHLEEQKEKREIEEYAMDLHDMHHHNQRLIEKHGHQDAPLVEKNGMFNFADFMDISYVKKAEKMRAEQVKKMTEEKMPINLDEIVGQK